MSFVNKIIDRNILHFTKSFKQVLILFRPVKYIHSNFLSKFTSCKCFNDILLTAGSLSNDYMTCLHTSLALFCFVFIKCNVYYNKLTSDKIQKQKNTYRQPQSQTCQLASTTGAFRFTLWCYTTVNTNKAVNVLKSDVNRWLHVGNICMRFTGKTPYTPSTKQRVHCYAVDPL